jgi:protoporphyrinogen/coproporphyrinogen III oxidase
MSSSSPNKRIAIVGGGISGLATAWQLAQLGVAFTLFEASSRLGGIVETVHSQGFVIECGPDSWVTEKPWARELACELGLGEQIVPSNDQWRRTYVQRGSDRLAHLVPIPDGMRMMVPFRWGPLLESPLFSWQARLAYLREPKRAAELKAAAPVHDESVADFVERHFGTEVARTIAAPLLGAVFGGDITQLSVRAVMPAFVNMEKEHGSLIQAAQLREQQSTLPIFTTLSTGLGTLIDRMAVDLPASAVRFREPVLQLEPEPEGWQLTTAAGVEHFHSIVLTTPPHVTARLLRQFEGGGAIGDLLPHKATSAIVVACAFSPKQAASMRIPRGFGFIVPPLAGKVPGGEQHPLLACTFVNQKFPGRTPDGAVLLRAFFGGASGDALQSETDEQLVELARTQLSRILGPLGETVETVVRRWPLSLPQYAVGHLDRMAELEARIATLPGLTLVGSAYYGVGLPDLIRQGRATARLLSGPEQRSL